MRHHRWIGATVASVLLCAGSACGSGDGSSGDRDALTFWTVLDSPPAMTAMEAITKAFTGQTGIDVKLVGMKDPQMAQTMTSAAAAGTLPDVVLHIVDRTVGWAAQGLLDTDAATGVVDGLGKQTFNPSALRYVQDGDGYAAVPSDGWGQLLFYRKDLFAKAGLAPPDTYQRITAAATALNGAGGVHGIVLGSKAGDRFTMQSFESMALANGCQLVNDAGTVTLDSPQCVSTISWYTDLLKKYSVGGEQDTSSTRATYLAGKAAMVSWSPHLLDELAGAAPDMPPACAQCAADKAWLARNTGIVAAIQGPDAQQPAQYGQISNLGITKGANVEAARKFVTYLLDDAYQQFLDIMPEGRFPMRTGTPGAPDQYVTAWPKLTAGAVAGAPSIETLYGATATTLAKSATGYSRWGFSQGKGGVASAVYGDLGLTRILSQVVTGGLSAQQAARQMQAAAEKLAAKR